jgi:aspartyl-tRNA(Asn)/glutamyl-tRNA(Gln) amidotransferase subunit C
MAAGSWNHEGLLPMSLDKATVARIATLARIEVPEAQQERLAGELSQILDWIEQLGEVDTDGVEPLRAVMPIAAHWREDAVTDGNRQGDVLKNAPKSHDGYFVVPKVVE